ncbi:hypothetical protein LCGC14_0935730 [marine sediment metagenome]|uniref:Uncharacterized protein n=1 Tax=marine sediment metagenome TaxID=412755 RepID=A0A0F9R573_9ZZZZ
MNGKPPVKYLCTSTGTMLQNFELTRLNVVANTSKEIRVALQEILDQILKSNILQECIELRAEALLCRWIGEYRGLIETDAVTGEPTWTKQCSPSRMVVPRKKLRDRVEVSEGKRSSLLGARYRGL